ncbi:MAG TPA: hypothetical protein VHC22_28770 [Pirellulales bacterium]|nr:hypothetical protein [Pirellulales bacterium]
MTILTNNLAEGRWRLGSAAVLAAILGGILAVSVIGCASKQPPPPKTVKEFLSQPRPK